MPRAMDRPTCSLCCVMQRGHLRGLDLSHLFIRGSSLQGVEMQDTSLVGATLQDYRLYRDLRCHHGDSHKPQRAVLGRLWQAWGGAGVGVGAGGHPDPAPGVAGAYGHSLCPCLQPGWTATRQRELGRHAQAVGPRKWSALLWSSWHPHGIQRLTFAPDGSRLASDGDDGTVRLWDLKLGTLLQEVPHPSAVFSVAWSPDGRLLASGDIDGHIRLWEFPPTGQPPGCGRSPGILAGAGTGLCSRRHAS